MHPTDVQREFVLFNVKTKDNHPWSVYALIRPLHVIHVCGLMGNCWFCFPFNLHHCVYFLGYNTCRGKVAVLPKKDGVNGFAATWLCRQIWPWKIHELWNCVRVKAPLWLKKVIINFVLREFWFHYKQKYTMATFCLSCKNAVFNLMFWSISWFNWLISLSWIWL